MNRLNTTIGAIVLVILAALWACTEEAAETTGVIYGKVIDSQSGEVLQGVTITLTPGGLSRTTGSDGTFEYLDLEAQQYQVQAQKSGYLTNTKTISVQIGKTASGDMQLEPEKEEAEIKIEPSTLNFGTTQTELSVTITNHGNAATEWSLDLGDNAWLTASPLSGNIAASKTQSIIFTVNRDKLSETKSVKVALSAFGNSYAIAVSCAPKNAKSEMTVTPTTLDFGHELSELPLTIGNTGEAELKYTVSGISTDYITVTPTEGSVAAGGNQVLQVKLNRGAMPENVNTTFVISDGTKQEGVTVKAIKPVAQMTISPLSLDFGKEATEQIFTISNTGTAELAWIITVPEGTGLKVSDVSGVIAPSGTKQITVTLDRSIMPETLNAAIEISDGARKEHVAVTAIKGSDIAGIVAVQGLYTYYKFDGNFDDATENQINGFGTASPTFVEGVTSEGKAVKFSKTANSTFVVSKPIIDSREMTISFWGKDFSDGHIFHLNSSIRTEPMFTLSMSNGSLKFLVTRYNNIYQYDALSTFVHPTLTDGKWHHIALVSDFELTTYSTITTALYVDGQEVYTLTEDANHFNENGGSQSSYDTGTSFTMGGSLKLSNSNTLPATNMSVDNFRVYDTRRLSASEIKEIYNAKQ